MNSDTADGRAGETPPDLPTHIRAHRRELLAHCYRMLGSPHEAEDVVQETLLRAWRALDGFAGRSSLRTWLYRIATRVCLSALEQRGRRPVPSGLDGTSADPREEPAPNGALPWLLPLPDAAVGLETTHAGGSTAAETAFDPAVTVVRRETVRLAFVAAVQHLAPRQRAVLLLREVLAFRATEVADMVGLSTAAVHSLTQRARARLAELAPEGVTSLAEPDHAHGRELLDRYVAAFERKDVTELARLCTDEVVWEMPPYPAWYRGPDDVATHLDLRCPGRPGGMSLVPLGINGGPGFALYLRADATEVFEAFCVQALTLTGAGISRVVNWVDAAVFDLFGLARRVTHRPNSGMREA